MKKGVMGVGDLPDFQDRGCRKRHGVLLPNWPKPNIVATGRKVDLEQTYLL